MTSAFTVIRLILGLVLTVLQILDNWPDKFPWE
jgi:hypothetical protein